MSKKTPSWLRWRVATKLDHSPKRCWADLAMWAQYEEPWRDLPNCNVTSMCFDGPGNTCYCGKLPKAGGSR